MTLGIIASAQGATPVASAQGAGLLGAPAKAGAAESASPFAMLVSMLGGAGTGAHQTPVSPQPAKLPHSALSPQGDAIVTGAPPYSPLQDLLAGIDTESGLIDTEADLEAAGAELLEQEATQANLELADNAPSVSAPAPEPAGVEALQGPQDSAQPGETAFSDEARLPDPAPLSDDLLLPALAQDPVSDPADAAPREPIADAAVSAPSSNTQRAVAVVAAGAAVAPQAVLAGQAHAPDAAKKDALSSATAPSQAAPGLGEAPAATRPAQAEAAPAKPQLDQKAAPTPAADDNAQPAAEQPRADAAKTFEKFLSDATARAPDQAAQSPAPQAADAPSRAAPTLQAAQPAPQQTVPVESLAIQIAHHAKSGERRFEIRLDPPELGKVSVRLEISRDGVVTTHLTVERAETMDLLQRDARALERALGQSGLDQKGGGVSFSLSDQNAQQQQDGRQDQRRAYGGSAMEAQIAETATEPHRARSALSLLDISI